MRLHAGFDWPIYCLQIVARGLSRPLSLSGMAGAVPRTSNPGSRQSPTAALVWRHIGVRIALAGLHVIRAAWQRYKKVKI